MPRSGPRINIITNDIIIVIIINIIILLIIITTTIIIVITIGYYFVIITIICVLLSLSLSLLSLLLSFSLGRHGAWPCRAAARASLLSLFIVYIITIIIIIAIVIIIIIIIVGILCITIMCSLLLSYLSLSLGRRGAWPCREAARASACTGCGAPRRARGRPGMALIGLRARIHGHQWKRLLDRAGSRISEQRARGRKLKDFNKWNRKLDGKSKGKFRQMWPGAPPGGKRKEWFARLLIITSY